MVRIIAFLLALAALQFAAFAQSLPDTGRAADAAEAVAARAAGTFEPIDPDNEMPAADDAAAVYAGLPPLSGAIPAAAPAPVAAEPAMAAEIEDMADIDADAPRGPAVRMISNPVVQALPAQAPAAVAKPAALAPAPKPAAPQGLGGGGFVIKSILPIEGTIRYGDWFWDESAAPASGPLVITVDLDARVISAFRDGHEIGTAVVLVGTQEHPTPLGTFPILTKERDNVSEKYNNAPMPWTLRLTWDGIAIHGSPVLNGYASHGCIGIPDDFAAKLFAAAKRGDKVIITRGRMVGLGDKIL
jgi:lipoprotein-anchoring transpeptidase ErfK/SrfK